MYVHRLVSALCCSGRCVEAGASRVVIAPYFLSRGRHIQEDIPALVAAAQQQYPGISCSIAEPIGEPALVLVRRRLMMPTTATRYMHSAFLHICLAAVDVS